METGTNRAGVDWLGSVTAGFVLAYISSLDPLIKLLFLMILADLLLGTMKAWKLKTLNSQVSRDGAMKKAASLIIVAVAGAVDHYGLAVNGITLPAGMTLAATVAGFYCASEGLSLLENAALIGVPVPQNLREILAKLNGSSPQPARREGE